MAYDYVEETGIIIADTSNVQTNVNQQYKDNFGDNLVTDKGSPASVLITADTTLRKNLQETAALITNQINPNLAGGIYLDAIWALTNGERRKSTSTTVTATITGVNGTVIPSGSIAETTTGDRFETISEIIIPASGTIDVSFQSVEKGAIPCVASSLINIADGGILGWETITNNNAGVLGLETQGDAGARVDRKLTLALGAKGMLFAISSGLYAINDVKSLKLQENYEDTTKVINNVSMTKHSIYLCVDGGTDEEVATALYNYKSLGCNYINGASSINQTVTINAPDTGEPYTAKFDRPDEIIIKIKITAKASPSATNPTDDIKNAILAYTNSEIRNEGFKVGIDVSPLEIASNTAVSTGYFVTDCQVTKQSVDVFQRETIDLEIWEKGVTSESLIEVILV